MSGIREISCLHRTLVVGLFGASIAAVPGCGEVTVEPSGGPTAGAGATGGGGSGGSATTTQPTSTSDGGGGTTAPICVPGEQMPCYSGPPGTQDIGPCKAGIHTCLPDGSAFGACEGETPPATESCTAAGDENCDGLECAQWAKVFLNPGLDRDQDIAAAPDGSVYFMGGTQEPFEFAGDTLYAFNGIASTFLAKLSPAGEELWGIEMTRLFRVAVDPAGNPVVYGWIWDALNLGGGELGYSGDIAVAKLDPDGKHIWSRGFGGFRDLASFFPRDVAAGPSGDVVIIGSFSGTVDFGDQVVVSPPTEDTSYVVKLDGATGATKWSRSFGNGSPLSVAIGPDHHITLAGAYRDGLAFNEPLPPAVEGGVNLFAARLDADGNPIWSRSMPCTKTCYVREVAVDASGAVVLTGELRETLDLGGATLAGNPLDDDAYVLKLDPSGQYEWSRHLAGPGDQNAWNTAVNSAGEILVPVTFDTSVDVGAGLLTSAGERDIALVKLSPAGEHLWSLHLGDAFDQPFSLVGVTGSDEIVFSAAICGAIDAGTGPVVASCTEETAWDIAIAKLGK